MENIFLQNLIPNQFETFFSSLSCKLNCKLFDSMSTRRKISATDLQFSINIYMIEIILNFPPVVYQKHRRIQEFSQKYFILCGGNTKRSCERTKQTLKLCLKQDLRICVVAKNIYMILTRNMYRN